MSLNQGTSSFVGNILGTAPASDQQTTAGTSTGYLAMWFPHQIASMSSNVADIQMVSSSTADQDFTAGWSTAKTPYIVSQTGSAATALGNTTETNLFKTPVILISTFFVKSPSSYP